MIEDKLLEESLDERTLIEEVNWLYSRLTKKEMTILLKWVSANCDTAVQKALDKVVKLIDEKTKNFRENYNKLTGWTVGDFDVIPIFEIEDLKQQLRNSLEKTCIRNDVKEGETK